MNFTRLISTILLLGIITSLTACDGLFQQRDRSYNDDPKLEFYPLTETVDESALSGQDTTITTSVQLIGPQQDSDLSVSYAVADSSTAEEGTHYTLGSTSATIPANSSSAEVSIEVLNNSTDDGDTNYELFLVLQDSDGVQAAENLKTYTLTIRGADE